MVGAIATVQMDHRGETLFPGVWGYTWWQIERPLERRYGDAMWCPPPRPTFRKPSFSFFGEPQGGQSFDSTSRAGSTISTSSGQVGLLRKKPRVEVPVSAPQPEKATMNQISQSSHVGNACASGTGSTQVRRDELFAKLGRKAQLYETAKDRFKKCLIYHNQHFHESLSKADFIKKAEVIPTLETSKVSK